MYRKCLLFFLNQIFAGSMTAKEVGEAKSLFLLLLFNIALTLSTMVFRAVINAHEKFLFLKGAETVELVLQPLLVILVLRQYPSAFSVAMVQTLMNIILILCGDITVLKTGYSYSVSLLGQ